MALDTQNQSSASSSTPVLEPNSCPSSPTSGAKDVWTGFFTPQPSLICEVCSAQMATVYCKNDQASLCDKCDAVVHLSNPLSARHEIVPIASVLPTGIDIGEYQCAGTRPTIKQEFGVDLDQPCVQPTMVTAPSGASTITEVPVVQEDANVRLLDAVSDLPVMELPVGNLPLDFESFEDIELDNEWIENLEKVDPCVQEAVLAVSQPSSEEDVQPGATYAPTRSTENGTSEGPVASNFEPGRLPLSQFPPAFLPFFPSIACSFAPGFPVVQPRHHTTTDASLDRKARVARYLEKKKNRTWENKIRYHSRKAYAENRPRIKGRFARPAEFEAYLKEQEAKKQLPGSSVSLHHPSGKI